MPSADGICFSGGRSIPGQAVSTIRCVHFLPTVRLDHGGVSRAVLQWCSVLARRGNRITLLTCDRTDIPAEWFSPSSGMPLALTVDLPGRLRGFNRQARAVVMEAVGQAEVLHIHAPWLPGNGEIAAAAKRLGVPYIVSCHGMLDDWSMAQRRMKKRAFMWLAGRRLLSGAARAHCTARTELRQASRWLGRARPVVLPYLLDLSPFRALPGAEPARLAFPLMRRPEPKILFMSRLHEKKGVDVLILAAAELRRQGVKFILLIAGPGETAYRRRLEALAQELGLMDITCFLGQVDGQEKISLLQSVDVMALPTQQENFGLVVAEALACGTPVVTTRGVDIWQELEAAGGVIVDRTPAAFAGAVAELLSDPHASRARGERGRRWVMEELDEDRLAGDYEQLYATVAGRGQAER